MRFTKEQFEQVYGIKNATVRQWISRGLITEKLKVFKLEYVGYHRGVLEVKELGTDDWQKWIIEQTHAERVTKKEQFAQFVNRMTSDTDSIRGVAENSRAIGIEERLGYQWRDKMIKEGIIVDNGKWATWILTDKDSETPTIRFMTYDDKKTLERTIAELRESDTYQNAPDVKLFWSNIAYHKLGWVRYARVKIYDIDLDFQREKLEKQGYIVGWE